MNKNLIDKLIALGFTTNEAKVYLATLELGTTKMTDLAKHSNTKRPTTYLIVDSLI